MLSHQQVGFWLCINDFLSFSLLIYLREFFFLCLKRRICLCYYSSSILNFHTLSRSLCSAIAVTRMHDILSYSVMSCTVAPTAHILIYIYIYMYWTSRRCLYQKVWIDIHYTSFSIVSAYSYLHASFIHCSLLPPWYIICDCKTKNQFRQVH
jgi:hypothetical protein